MKRKRSLNSVDGSTQRRSGAFEDLLSPNLDALHRLAVRLCGEAEEAEDLLQDAVLRAFERRSQLRDPQAGRAWLFKILVNTHLNRRRNRKRRPEIVESDLSEGQFEAALADWSAEKLGDDWLDRLGVGDRVRRALDAIDPRFRGVLLLSDVEEFSQREVAGILDLPEGTVASRLFRGRRALREILSEAVRDKASRRAT